MSASQQAENCLGIRLVWDIIQEKTIPADRDFALHAVGKDLVERNADIYQEALTNVEILRGMFANVASVSGSASALIPAKDPHLHFDEHEALSKEIADFLRQSGVEKRNTLSRSKSQAQRFHGITEACHKQEKFKASKVVQRILSSRTASAMSGETDARQFTYVSNTLFDGLTSVSGVCTSPPAPPERRIPATKFTLSSVPHTVMEKHASVDCANEPLSHDNDDDHKGEDSDDIDFYAIDNSPAKRQPENRLERQPGPREAPLDPYVYDASTLRKLKLTASNYTGDFVVRIRELLEAEYNYLLRKVEKIQDTITNTAKVNEIALTISQELLESTKSLTEADITRLRDAAAPYCHDQDSGMRSAKPLLASPSHSTAAPLATSMSALKCLPKIGK